MDSRTSIFTSSINWIALQTKKPVEGASVDMIFYVSVARRSNVKSFVQ